MDPTEWGPHMWNVLHTVAFSLSYDNNVTDKNEEKLSFFALLDNISSLLPCEACKQHCKEYLNTKHPRLLKLKNEDLAQWTVTFHNEVNARLGKPKMPFSEALSLYQKSSVCDAGCDKTDTHNSFVFIAVLAILLLILVLLFYKSKQKILI